MTTYDSLFSRIDSKFLYGVETDLNEFSKKLFHQELCARSLRTQAGNYVNNADRDWVGPRADTVIGDARDYLDVVEEYPEALKSARGTFARWAKAANRIADEIASQEQRLETPWAPTHDDDGDPVIDPFGADAANAEIELLRGEWGRTCVTFGNELDGAIGAIRRVNSATSVPVDKQTIEYLATQLWLHQLGGPDAVRRWWAGLTDEQRLMLLATNPDLGKVDGLPPRARGMADGLPLHSPFEHLSQAEKDRLARQFAPELRFHPGEDNMPIDPLDLIAEGVLDGGRLDIDDDQHDGDLDGTPLLYEFIEDEYGNTYIRYWLGYANNDGPGPQNHEGDWESIEVKVSDPDGDGNFNGDSVAYSGHHSPTYRDWDDAPHNDEGRPIVYVAKGSHANYPTTGDWNSDAGDAIEDYARDDGRTLDLADRPGRDITREQYWNDDIEMWGQDSPYPEWTGPGYDETDGTSSPYDRGPLHQHGDLSDEQPDEPNGNGITVPLPGDDGHIPLPDW